MRSRPYGAKLMNRVGQRLTHTAPVRQLRGNRLESGWRANVP